MRWKRRGHVLESKLRSRLGGGIAVHECSEGRGKTLRELQQQLYRATYELMGVRRGRTRSGSSFQTLNQFGQLCMVVEV